MLDKLFRESRGSLDRELGGIFDGTRKAAVHDDLRLLEKARQELAEAGFKVGNIRYEDHTKFHFFEVKGLKDDTKLQEFIKRYNGDVITDGSPDIGWAVWTEVGTPNIGSKMGRAFWVSPRGEVYPVAESHSEAAKDIPGLEKVNLDPESEDISGALDLGWVRARMFGGSLEASIPNVDSAPLLDELISKSGISPSKYSIEIGHGFGAQYIFFKLEDIKTSIADTVRRQLRAQSAPGGLSYAYASKKDIANTDDIWEGRLNPDDWKRLATDINAGGGWILDLYYSPSRKVVLEVKQHPDLVGKARVIEMDVTDEDEFDPENYPRPEEIIDKLHSIDHTLRGSSIRADRSGAYLRYFKAAEDDALQEWRNTGNRWSAIEKRLRDTYSLLTDEEINDIKGTIKYEIEQEQIRIESGKKITPEAVDQVLANLDVIYDSSKGDMKVFTQRIASMCPFEFTNTDVAIMESLPKEEVLTYITNILRP